MKTKLASLLAAGMLFAGVSATLAGPRVAVSVNTGGYCPPVRAYCPPVYPAPIYRAYPTSCVYPQPAFYSWGPSVVVYSSAPSYGFSTVSPVLNYAGSTPVYQVSPPVVPAPPIIVSPVSTFGWKH